MRIPCPLRFAPPVFGDTEIGRGKPRAVTIPKGFYLAQSFGTSAISGSWQSYSFGNYTQKAANMGFEYDYRPTSYTITYNMNGGTNASSNPSSYNVLYGVSFATPTRTGYTFSKWTNSSGTTVTGINVGANATFSSATDLYNKCNARTTGNYTVNANWTANTYTVSYNANGGSGTMSSSTATYDQGFTTRPCTFTKTGFAFNGWNTKADGTGTEAWDLNSTGVYESGQGARTWKYTSGRTLYAQWRPATGTVVYDANAFKRMS